MPSEEVLQAAAVRLVKAMALYRVAPTVAAADRVIAARIAVKEAFIAAGWQPPESTLAAMERDRLLLREHSSEDLIADLEAPGTPDRPDAVERRRHAWKPAPASLRLAFSCSSTAIAAT